MHLVSTNFSQRDRILRVPSPTGIACAQVCPASRIKWSSDLKPIPLRSSHENLYFQCRAEPPSQERKAEKLPKELRESTWSVATVVENKAVSVDGGLRTLVLSVEDKVVYLEGRSMHRKQERPRWADTYKVPGQFVAVRKAEQDGKMPDSEGLGSHSTSSPHLYAVSSSPYAVRRDSADLDASIIEILVDRTGEDHERWLTQLGPGELLEVSSIFGRGYTSLFNGYVGLMSALEESRNILLIGAGSKGIAPLRSVLEWTPVQAHATAHRVTLLYACPSATSAAFIKDWDSWREAGVVVLPLYLEEGSSGGDLDGQPADLQARLLSALVGGEQGLAGAVGGDPREATILISGLPGSVAAAVSRELTMKGAERERILFCDYF